MLNQENVAGRESYFVRAPVATRIENHILPEPHMLNQGNVGRESCFARAPTTTRIENRVLSEPHMLNQENIGRECMFCLSPICLTKRMLVKNHILPEPQLLQ